MNECSSLHHPNIVQLMGITFDNDSILIVMEFMENGSVKDLLQRQPGKIDWKLRISMVRDSGLIILVFHGQLTVPCFRKTA